MDLKSFLPEKEPIPKELYWSLVIEPEWVQAGIWYIGEAAAEVISVGPTTAWLTDEELIDAADATLSAAIQKLPENSGEPTKTVFGVSSAWVSEGQIKPEYLEKIKNLCAKLSLEPVGFVVLGEAISHFIKSEEGSPLNGVICCIGKENIEISLFRLGNQVGATTVSRSVNSGDDIAEGLSRFATDEPFPSRLILYDGKEGELDETRQVILAANWEDYEKVKFLHTPKVEIFSPEKKVSAVCLAGAAEIAKVTKLTPSFVKEEMPSQEQEEQEEEVKREEPEEVGNVKEVQEDNLGFVLGRDIATTGSSQQIQAEPGEQITQPTTFGMPIPPNKVSGAMLPKIKNMGNKITSSVGGLFNRLTSFFHLPKTAEPKAGGGKNPLIIGGLFFLAILIFGFIYWWYYPKAKIVIFVSPKKLEQTVEFSIKSGMTSVDLGEKIVPGKLITRSESGEKTAPTTGTKTVGERAKGEVKFFRSGGEIKLNSGTSLKTSAGLEFTLDEGVTIASGSASTPGTATAKVTAGSIGSEYNLAAGSSFEVGNYPTSDIEAKNESAFSGGSSREINAVAKEDQENLEKDLAAELKDKASDNFESELSEGEYLIKESLNTSVEKREFSNKVGDEATTLKLNLSVEASSLVIKKEDLMLLAKEVLKDKVASGFALREDQIDTSFELLEEDKGEYKLKMTLKVNLLPEIKLDEITSKIAGKYPPLAEEYLTGIEGFTGAKVTLNPQFPGRLGIIPRVRKNIFVEIEAE